MSDNPNQPIARTGPESSGNVGHFDQGGRRNNQSGNRNNRRRRPSQQIGGEQSANHSQRPAVNNSGTPAHQHAPSAAAQSAGSQVNAQAGRQQQNQPARQDPYQQRRNNSRPSRPIGPSDTHNVSPAAKPAQANVSQNVSRSSEKSEQINERQISAPRNEKTESQAFGKESQAFGKESQAFGNRKNNANPSPRTDRPREPRTWGRNIRTEETHEDIHRENERLEKEIWLEIASIHTYKLD